MEISDPKAIRALAHPLRLDLLDLLVATGPATAAQCGRVLQASQASCSFHLRQLAKYGLVEDAGPGSDRRERLWRSRAEADNTEWQGTGGSVSAVALVSAAEAAEIRAKWKELLEPYLSRAVGSGLRLQPGQRYVRYFMAGTPLPGLDQKDAHHDSDD